MGNSFLLVLCINSLKLEIKQTVPSFQGIINVGAAHVEFFSRFKTYIFTNLLTSILRVSLCVF